jgi:hypothetical protein
MTITITIGLTAIAYWTCLAVISRSSFRFSEVTRADIDVDVLVVGNSRAVNLLTQSTAGSDRRVFNLGYNGQSYGAAFALVRSFFEEGNRAKTVVVETSGLFFEAPNCEDKAYWAMLPQLSAAQRPGCPEDAWSAKYFPLTQFNSELFLRALYYTVGRPNGDQSWANEYSIPERLCNRLPLRGIEDDFRASESVNPAQVKQDVSQLKSWLANHGHGAKLSFVIGPYFISRTSSDMVREIRGRTLAILDESKVLDLSEALGSRCDSYADAVHVNAEGRARLWPLIRSFLEAQ